MNDRPPVLPLTGVKLSVNSKLKPSFRILLTAVLVLFLALGSWIQWGGLPRPDSPGQVTDPAIVVVLGGGDSARSSEAARLASAFPQVPLLVTGDSGFLVSQLESFGIKPPRLQIEHHATSTWENALFSKPWITDANKGQVVLVTNDFHAARSLAVFRKVYPDRDIVVSCESPDIPYNPWEQGFRRRERAAVVYYVLRYGVWRW